VSDAGAVESRRASIEDVDLGKVILELKTQEMAYQTALAVTSRALQPSLMSFLP
jgi:flagellar hook-associated protein 3 FlgL